MAGALIRENQLHAASTSPRQSGAARAVVESAYYEGDRAIIAVRASGNVGLCPSCGLSLDELIAFISGA